MTNFPGANRRVPDLFNLILINKEIAALEEDVLDARYIGEKEITVNDTAFTNTTIATPVELNNTEVGTADFATNTEAVVTPGNTLTHNSTTTTFTIVHDGTALFANTDVVTVISNNGSLNIGASTTISVLTTMTLDALVTAINLDTATTGIRGAAIASGSDFFLRLSKDNVLENATLMIKSTTTASVLTDLGITANDTGHVIDIVDLAALVGADGTVVGSSPFNLDITNTNGVYIVGGTGTALADIGLIKTIDLATDTIRITSHGFTTGDQISLTSPGTLPIPINAFPNSLYFIIVVDANNIRLATTSTRAFQGTALDLTLDGTNYFTVKATSNAEIYFQVTNGFATNPVFKQRMDEVIAYFQGKEYIIFRQTNPNVLTVFQWVIRW